ncbi:MAG: chorismate mutase [Hyphomonadaceae bacterium]|nr:chorismate mutase [Hyphomonadaceae bacterium]
MNDGGTRDAFETIRSEIEGVDSALMALFAQRLQLCERISAPLSPAREIEMLRRLIAIAPATLDRELLFEIWRALMAAAQRKRRVIDVVVGGGRGDPARLFDSARRHFGARTRIKDLGEPQAALQRASENPDAVVAVTTWPAGPGVGAWWPALSERRFANLRLVAALPVLGDAEPEAAVFAALDPEPAGGDTTLALAFDPHHRVQRALAEQGLVGKEIARAEPRVLLRIEGFLAIDDPRAAAMTRAGLDSVRVLGSYARL